MMSNAQQSETSRRQDELTRTVVVVVVVFCICQLANPIRRILLGNSPCFRHSVWHLLLLLFTHEWPARHL